MESENNLFKNKKEKKKTVQYHHIFKYIVMFHNISILIKFFKKNHEMNQYLMK